MSKKNQPQPKNTVTDMTLDVGIFRNLFIENQITGANNDLVKIPNISTSNIISDNDNDNITIESIIDGGYNMEKNKKVYDPVKFNKGAIILENNPQYSNSILVKSEIEELIVNKINLFNDYNNINKKFEELEKKIEVLEKENKILKKQISNLKK